MKTTHCTAITLHAGQVELAQAHVNGAGPSLARQERLPLETGLATLAQQVDARTQRIVTAVSGEDVWFQVLSLPSTDPKELEQMLELQLDSLTPLPREEVVHGFESLGTSLDSTQVLVAIASKAAVNERVAALEAAGLPPAAVSVDTLAIYRDCQRQGRLATDERLHALVLLTTTALHVVLHSANQPLAIRVVYMADAGAAHVLAELQRTLMAAQLQHARPAGQVLLAAVDAPCRAVAEELGAAWPQAEVLSEQALPTPAACLALQAGTLGPATINLLPDQWRQQRRRRRYRKLLVRAGIGLAALYVLALVGFMAVMAVEQSRVQAVQAQIAGLQPSYTAARQLHGTLSAMKLQLDSQYSALEVLRETTQLLPADVVLSGFAFKKDQSITLRGQSASAVNANEFISRLENSALFGQVKTVSVRTERNQTKFELVCSLRSAAPMASTPVRRSS